MLRHERTCIDDPCLDVIAEILGERLHDDFEGAPAIMASQVLDVLKQEGLRAVVSDNARDIKKQRSLGWVIEPVQASQGIFLGYSGD